LIYRTALKVDSQHVKGIRDTRRRIAMALGFEDPGAIRATREYKSSSSSSSSASAQYRDPPSHLRNFWEVQCPLCGKILQLDKPLSLRRLGDHLNSKHSTAGTHKGTVFDMIITMAVFLIGISLTAHIKTALKVNDIKTVTKWDASIHDSTIIPANAPSKSKTYFEESEIFESTTTASDDDDDSGLP
jgi:hypothetical protein